MSQPEHESDVLIKEQHLDTFGHVNNATYLQLLEQARWDFITQNGYGIDTIQRLKQGPVILEAHLVFKKEIKNRQKIRITTRLESYRGKIATMTQSMRNEQGKVCCDARFVFGLFDLEARRLIDPTPAWFAALGWVPADRPE